VPHHKNEKKETITYEIVKCGVYSRLVNSRIRNFFQKNVPKFHQVNVLGKIDDYEPMT
jgi:hypothetical protein